MKHLVVSGGGATVGITRPNDATFAFSTQTLSKTKILLEKYVWNNTLLQYITKYLITFEIIFNSCVMKTSDAVAKTR